MDRNKQQGAAKIIIIVGLLVLILVGAGTGAALYLSGVLAGDDAGVAGTDGAPAAAAEPPRGPAQYLELDPAITVNIGRDGRRAVLQARVQLMARDEMILQDVRKHMPLVRNNLILLFSEQEYDALTGREGKEALQRLALDEINAILEQESAQGPVEALYFTSFVMQ